MEITVAYFQLIRYSILTILFLCLYFSFKRKHTKTGIFLIVLSFIFIVISPIKYDGTNTNEYSKQNIIEKDRLIIEIEPKTRQKITFKQRILLEDLRSKKENNKLNKELKL